MWLPFLYWGKPALPGVPAKMYRQQTVITAKTTWTVGGVGMLWRQVLSNAHSCHLLSATPEQLTLPAGEISNDHWAHRMDRS